MSRPPATGDWIDLVGRIIADTPALPGAACRDHPELFDPQHDDETATDADYRHAAAQAICASCPALAACRAWVEALPPRDRPAGIVAGQITTPTKRAAKSA